MAREKTTYANKQQCIQALGLDPQRVNAALKLGGAEAGLNSNYSVNGLKLKVWMDDHAKEIDDYLSRLTIDDVKLENALKDGVLKDIQIAKETEKIIKPEELIEFLTKIFSAQEAVIKKWRREYSPKTQMKTLPESERVWEEASIELLSIFKGGIESWQSYLKS